MKYPAECKLCHRPLLLEIDDSYDVMGDPKNLLPMATCNRCYDLRDRRESLHKAIGTTCYGLTLYKTPSEVPAPVRERFKGILEELTKRYAQWFCDFHNLTPWQNCWDAMLAESMLKQPRRWENMLREYRKAFRPT